jgi:hypothetical protein
MQAFLGEKKSDEVTEFWVKRAWASAFSASPALFFQLSNFHLFDGIGCDS